jgi:hypothetical protein
MILSMEGFLRNRSCLIVVQHAIFRSLDIVEIAAFDCPDKEEPGTGADT